MAGLSAFFTALRTEGAILPPDRLRRIREGDTTLEGLKPADYHLPEGTRPNEAVNRLEALMDGEVCADFALLRLLVHQSRVESEKPEDCWLEREVKRRRKLSATPSMLSPNGQTLVWPPCRSRAFSPRGWL